MKTNLSSCCNAGVRKCECLCLDCRENNHCNNTKCGNLCDLASPELTETNKEWEKEYCEKFGLCKDGEKCQCRKELAFIYNLISTKEKELKQNIGLLRQWLNEMPDNFRELTNEDLEAFLINKE